MRRSLMWLLLAALGLSAVALWVPQRASTIVGAIEGRRSADSLPVVAGAPAMSVLPAALEPLVVDAARRDPFADAAAPVAPKPAPVVATAPPAMVAPAPPLPPPMTWRLLGTMDTPGGERLVMLVQHNGVNSVLAVPGLMLEGGYEVVAVLADGVRVVHRPSQTEVVIPIPVP